MIELPVIHGTDGAQDAEACKKCGGECCQRMPGIAFPEDFGPADTLVDVLEEYLKTGFWAVDWWEGDPRDDIEDEDDWLLFTYFVRPATVKAKGELLDASWGGTCVLWSKEYGCSLKFENRPKMCRTLVPTPEEGHCTGPANSSKHAAALAWIPYQNQIEAVLQRLGVAA